MPPKINLVNALILNENKQVLVTHNCKNRDDRYEFSGGKINSFETPEQATIRENLEELGIRIRITGVFGDYPTYHPIEGKFICRTYFAEIVEGTPRSREPKKMDWCDYLSYQQLLELKEQGTLVPNLEAALPDLRSIVA